MAAVIEFTALTVQLKLGKFALDGSPVKLGFEHVKHHDSNL